MHATGSQYEARQVDEDDVYTHQVFEPNGHDYIGPNMTRAQASVIEFAFNAIRSGHRLYAVPAEDDSQLDDVTYAVYNGPTEGIRS